jgi:enterochelin esterase family protein
LFVYTPPSYDSKASERYPVVFLLHGMGDDESAWLEVGKANFITDSLIADGKAQPPVIVMPYGHAVPDSRHRAEAFASNTDNFERDLLEDVIPFVRERYSVRVDALGQAIVGLSMGGGQSTTIGLRNLDKFAWIGGFSSAVSGQRADERFPELISDVGKSNEQIRLLWIGCGSSDFLFQRNKSFITWLESKGIDHTYRETEGGHSWRVWRKYLAEFMPLLFVEN